MYGNTNLAILPIVCVCVNLKCGQHLIHHGTFFDNFDNVTQKICLEYGAAPREVKSKVDGAHCNMGTLQCHPATRCLPANLLQSPIIDNRKNNHSSLLAMIAKSVGKSSTSICIFNDKLLVIRGISSCPRTVVSLNSVWGK